MMLVRLCNIAEIFPKDGWVLEILLGFLVCMGSFISFLLCTLAFQVHAKDQISRQRYYAWVIASCELWRDHVEVDCQSVVPSQPVHECNPSQWIGAGLKTEEKSLANPRPRSMALPHRIFPFFFFFPFPFPSVSFFPFPFFFLFFLLSYDGSLQLL